MLWAAATATIAGFGYAGMSAANHITSGNAPTASAEPTSIWRAGIAPAGLQAADAKRYLFSSSVTFTSVSPQGVVSGPQLAKADPFDAVVKKADVTPEKLAALFKREKTPHVVVALKDSQAAKKAAKNQAVAAKKAKAEIQVALAEASSDRFAAVAPMTPKAKKQADIILAAYAPREQNAAADVLHKLAEQEAQDQTEAEVASLPEEDENLVNAPLPTFRPDMALKPGKRAVAVEQDEEDDDIRVVKPGERPQVAEKPVIKPLGADKPNARQRMAAVVPEETRKPTAGTGWSFRNLFTGNGSGRTTARAGKGVAVYDITAKKVYMPDGSVLTAYSGMGKMANNPKYVHVRMNGPTPPHTYNLRMREKRFHGVEAIRMLPVDGRNKHGRDGFLTHSQLVRGQQSHGCVAFADYNKFLNAFKQGKVKQLVVVASGGRAAAAAQMARN